MVYYFYAGMYRISAGLYISGWLSNSVFDPIYVQLSGIQQGICSDIWYTTVDVFRYPVPGLAFRPDIKLIDIRSIPNVMHPIYNFYLLAVVIICIFLCKCQMIILTELVIKLYTIMWCCVEIKYDKAIVIKYSFYAQNIIVLFIRLFLHKRKKFYINSSLA